MYKYKKSTMKGHIDKKHSNQGNHKCEPCEFVAKNNQTLNMHIHAAHENPEYSGQECDFKAKSTL